MNNFLNSKSFVGWAIFAVHTVMVSLTQFGVDITQGQELAITNDVMLAVAIYSLITGHLDALYTMPPGMMTFASGFAAEPLKPTSLAEPTADAPPVTPQSGFIARGLLMTIIALGVVGVILLGGCSPCRNVPAEVVTQAPAIVDKLDTVLASPNVSAIPADMAAHVANIKTALTSPQTPACQMPGWISFGLEVLKIVVPIILQEAPKILTVI